MKTHNTPKSPTAKLKPIFDEVFKYEIGDVVASSEQLVTDAAEIALNTQPVSKYSAESRYWAPPGPMTINGRHMEECYGGIQCHYRVTGLKDGAQVSMTLQEHQIVSYELALESRRKLVDARSAANED